MRHTTLVPEIREIQERLQKVKSESENYADHLLQIIHRTGWTDTEATLYGSFWTPWFTSLRELSARSTHSLNA
jgi:hypothetical protein